MHIPGVFMVFYFITLFNLTTKTEFLISVRDDKITIIAPGSYSVSKRLDADYNAEVIKGMLYIFISKGLSGKISGNGTSYLYSICESSSIII